MYTIGTSGVFLHPPENIGRPIEPETLRAEEFRALRATIRERGTLRLGLAAAGLTAWAALHVAVQAWLPSPVTLLVPLLALAGVFEAIFALHVGVERIGRYLQAAFETSDPNGPRWEHTAEAFGRAATDPAGKLDALFAVAFVSATLLNLVPVVLLTAGSGQGDPGVFAELALYGGLHLVFIVRVARARRFASRQRAQELSLFERLGRPD
ncbi:MAG TPA: hypothetical protein PKW63_07315 [Vicinamibacterales bacterium]|nr:hypothetical protein [Acidobacteriota bacterium]HQX81549.1 hypothetical protein [Vicinamibacterales bacterium]